MLEQTKWYEIFLLNSTLAVCFSWGCLWKKDARIYPTSSPGPSPDEPPFWNRRGEGPGDEVPNFEFIFFFLISGDWVESPFCEGTGIDNDFKMVDASCGWWNPVNVFCVSCCLPLSVSENRSYRYQGMSERRAIAERSPSSQDSSITGFIRYEHLVAGISGGVTSTLILHPLDLIKIRFQGKMISHNNCKQYDDPESEFLTIIPETCQKGGKK